MCLACVYSSWLGGVKRLLGSGCTVTSGPAEKAWKAWLALWNETAPPTPFALFRYLTSLDLPKSHSSKQVSTDIVSDLLQLQFVGKIWTEHVLTFTCCLVCKRCGSLSAGIHTSCFFLTKTKPRGPCQCEHRQDLLIFKMPKCRGGSFLAPVVVK